MVERAHPEAAPLTAVPPPAPPAIRWSGSGALRGVAYVGPAALVTLADVSSGLAFAVGLIPAAVVGLAPTRRARWSTAVVGVLAGVPIVVGSVVAHVPVVAVAAVFLLALATVELARHRPRLGLALMSLALPMVGVGLSYTDVGEALGIAGLIVAGSLYAAVVSMAWPEHGPPAGADVRPPGGPPIPPRVYGVQLGLAGATAAAIGFALDLDHVGWATAACLLVMRPLPAVQRLRSEGRIVSVVIGAFAAGVLAHATRASAAYCVAVVVVLALAAGTQGSRWYVTPTFTTFLALSLLVYADPATAGSRFGERVLETVLGVALALLFGPGLGHLLRRGRSPVAP